GDGDRPLFGSSDLRSSLNKSRGSYLATSWLREEDSTMLKSRLVIATVLGTLSTVPAWAAPAQNRENQGQKQEEPRVYDSAHGDYHNWNADEDRRYREYLNEHHQKYQEFSRL